MFCLRIGSSYEWQKFKSRPQNRFFSKFRTCAPVLFILEVGQAWNSFREFVTVCNHLQINMHSCKKNASTKSTPILRRLGLWVCPRLQLGFLSFLPSLQNLYLRLVVYISRFFRWLCQKIGKGEYLLCKVSLEVTSNVLSFSMNIFLSCFTAHWSVYIGLCRVWSLPLSNQL